MRYLFVYQDDAKDAAALIEALGVKDDVRLVFAKKGETGPSAPLVQEIQADGDPEAAVCGVVRKYQSAVAQLCKIKHKTKEFRTADLVLREWLAPTPVVVDTSTPSEAFEKAKASGARFHIAENALVEVDLVPEHRHAFVRKAVEILTYHASNPAGGGSLRNSSYFAQNGTVEYKYRIVRGGVEVAKGSTRWHLKAGDYTTRESAARIYFDVVKIGNEHLVVVLYAGPHPKDGTYSAVVQIEASGNAQ